MDDTTFGEGLKITFGSNFLPPSLELDLPEKSNFFWPKTFGMYRFGARAALLQKNLFLEGDKCG